MTDTEAEIKAFLAKYIPVHNLTEHDNIFELGFINSLFAAQLISFVERSLGVNIPDEYLEMYNFQTISAIENLVMELRRRQLGI